MLNSILLHLEGAEQARPVIRVGVALARKAAARVRGITLLDTRRAESAYDAEAAVYAVMEHTRQALVARQHEAVRGDLSRACLEADLDFDVRRTTGDPLQVLPQEARFHDLVITAIPQSTSRDLATADLSRHDLTALLHRGAQPLLIVPHEQQTIRRVLLAYDGSEASCRAIRSFLNLDIFADAEHRLLAIGDGEAEARSALSQMADYCLARRPLETGYACGKVRKVLLPYASKWQADLIVLGIERGNRLLHWLLGSTTLDLIGTLRCALFAAA